MKAHYSNSLYFELRNRKIDQVREIIHSLWPNFRRSLDSAGAVPALEPDGWPPAWKMELLRANHRPLLAESGRSPGIS